MEFPPLGVPDWIDEVEDVPEAELVTETTEEKAEDESDVVEDMVMVSKYVSLLLRRYLGRK